jgi:hypothetical protein
MAAPGQVGYFPSSPFRLAVESIPTIRFKLFCYIKGGFCNGRWIQKVVKQGWFHHTVILSNDGPTMTLMVFHECSFDISVFLQSSDSRRVPYFGNC